MLNEKAVRKGIAATAGNCFDLKEYIHRKLLLERKGILSGNLGLNVNVKFPGKCSFCDKSNFLKVQCFDVNDTFAGKLLHMMHKGTVYQDLSNSK